MMHAMQAWIIGLFAALSISASCSSSMAMDFSLFPTESTGKVIVATGEIFPGVNAGVKMHQA